MQQQIRTFNRRQLLRSSGLGIGSLGLQSLIADDQKQSESSGPHFEGKAKRVIHFFLNGGPSHVDTFDQKPQLQRFSGKSVPTNLLFRDRVQRTDATRVDLR
ncbi:MAG: DUF1501 domain-containing protein, partial [Planctomycetaceae bacterium]